MAQFEGNGGSSAPAPTRAPVKAPVRAATPTRAPSARQAPSRGSGGSSGAAMPMGAAAPAAAPDQNAQAANFGWSLAVLNSNPELKSLFEQATAAGPNGGWTTEHFVAKVRDTQWFKSTADTARQTLILQKADPATYAARLNQTMAQVRAMVGSTGAQMTADQFNTIGGDALKFGWNTDQLRQNMAAFVTAGTGGQYAGGAGAHQFAYSQLASEYGENIDPVYMGHLIRNTVMGTVTNDTVRNDMIARASSRYPALASRLAGGETVRQIADPYIQSYARTLELNPNTVNLSDSLVQGALSGADAKGQPATKSVWQFEQDLRNDPRYMKTQQAQDSSMQMARRVLTDWGVGS